jgi:hypothetical protein
MRVSLPLALATLLALAASAAAHVTIAATGPADPVAVGQEFEIEGTASANCAVVLSEYQAMGKDRLALGLSPDAPAYFAWEEHPFDWTVAQCSTNPADQGNAIGHGHVHVTVGPNAPGLKLLNLTIVAYSPGSTTPEGGTPATVTIRVAYYANATLTLGAPVVKGDTTTIPVQLTYTANAATRLTLAATSDHATVSGLPAGEDLLPPAASNKTTLTRSWEATVSGFHGGPASVTISASLAPKDVLGAKAGFVATKSVVAPAPAVAGASASASTSKASPLPLPFLALAGALLVASRRHA